MAGTSVALSPTRQSRYGDGARYAYLSAGQAGAEDAARDDLPERERAPGSWRCVICRRDLGPGRHHGVRQCVCGRCFSMAVRVE